jgi:Glycosyltransferase 61
MQQLYRCWSWWLANPQKHPILVFLQNKKTLENPFLNGYIKVLENTIGLKVVKRHAGPAVRAKDTGKWKTDIEVTDFAMLDPDRQLRKLFMSQIPAVLDPPCKDTDNNKRSPRIAILNRNMKSGRHLMNAKELAASIEATFPNQTVSIVSFEEGRTFFEQIQFFMETDILISPHGAQLTGIPFMPSCSSVLEFFPRNYLVADYFGSLAAAVGIDHSYFYLAGNSIPKKKRYHYIVDGQYRNKTQCPETKKVMSAVFDLVDTWRSCCSTQSSMVDESKVQMSHKRAMNAKLVDKANNDPMIDIISTGTTRRPKLHAAQSETFGSHRLVRNFWKISEANDTDANCHGNLTKSQIQKVADFCYDTTGLSIESILIRTELFKPINHVGWFCSQKRPIEGLYFALSRYKNEPLPDYLMLIDDDTYVNVDTLIPTLLEFYPQNELNLIAGCGYEWTKQQLNFVYPVYGFGSILSRASIERLMKPIYCKVTKLDNFSDRVCSRLQKNTFGEKQMFHDGMSVSDLMYAFASVHPFSDVQNWQPGLGFCFHREHALAYFFNSYGIAISDENLSPSQEINNHQIPAEHSYTKLTGVDECVNVYGQCGDDARICHKMKPDQIIMLHNRQRKVSQNMVSSSTDSTTPDSTATGSTVSVIPARISIDVVSAGSTQRRHLLDMQARTFGSHPFVRDFYGLTEHNDTDATCSTSLTENQRQQVLQFCTNGTGQTRESRLFRTDLFAPSNNSTGWLCAQKRPIDGLHVAFEKYKSNQTTIPDYLMLIDDDTYLNIDALAATFQRSYPPTENHLVAGCTYLRPRRLKFVFPVGGVGSIFTRATLQKILKPIYCEMNATVKYEQDPFTRWTCLRLEQNLVGEKQFFSDGMSVGDLMYAYSSNHPYTRVEQWNHSGYCFHSDHTLGYFFNYYHVSVPDFKLKRILQPTAEVRKQHSYKAIADSAEIGHSGTGGECDNLRDKCAIDSRICHYVNSSQMEYFFNSQRNALRVNAN